MYKLFQTYCLVLILSLASYSANAEIIKFQLKLGNGDIQTGSFNGSQNGSTINNISNFKIDSNEISSSLLSNLLFSFNSGWESTSLDGIWGQSNKNRISFGIETFPRKFAFEKILFSNANTNYLSSLYDSTPDFDIPNAPSTFTHTDSISWIVTPFTEQDTTDQPISFVPEPEPFVMILFGLGLIGFVVIRGKIENQRS